MSSTSVVNYSLRQNKSIERTIVFDGARLLIDELHLESLVYVGLGSVWFTDFHLAHRSLGIQDMFSVEADQVVYERAQFNRPYRCVEVLQGQSSDVLPALLERERLQGRPWVVWLDYDRAMDEDKLQELKALVVDLPADSLLLTTFNASGRPYGTPAAREQRLQSLFGDAAPTGLSVDYYKEDSFAQVLAQCVENTLLSKALDVARPGSYVPAFSLTYQDGTRMATVGGLLPSPARRDRADEVIESAKWEGKVDGMIRTAPLTLKESLALQEALPREQPLTREEVQDMGFDLDEDHIRSFQRHYLRYPSFVELAR